MPATTPITMLASAVQTTSGSGSSVDLGPGNVTPDDTIRLYLDCTAISGTATTLGVTVETSRDGTVWRPLGTFTPKQAIGTEMRVFAPCDRYVRATWTIEAAASPSVTFAVAGERFTPYANLADLGRLAVAAKALKSFSNETKQEQLDVAGSKAEGWLVDAGFVLPFASWPKAVRSDICKVAAWYILSTQVGFDSQGNSDVAVRTNFEDAVTDLKRGAYSGIVDATPDVEDRSAAIVSEPRRGWC